MVFLEILKIYRKSTFVGVSNLMKLHDFSKTIKREIQTQVFPCEFYETFKPRKTVRSIWPPPAVFPKLFFLERG